MLHIRDQFILIIIKEMVKFYGLSKWKYKFVHILWKSFSCYFLLLSIYPTIKHAHLYKKKLTQNLTAALFILVPNQKSIDLSIGEFIQ